jgi:hypothetical protein
VSLRIRLREIAGMAGRPRRLRRLRGGARRRSGGRLGAATGGGWGPSRRLVQRRRGWQASGESRPEIWSTPTREAWNDRAKPARARCHGGCDARFFPVPAARPFPKRLKIERYFGAQFRGPGEWRRRVVRRPSAVVLAAGRLPPIKPKTTARITLGRDVFRRSPPNTGLAISKMDNKASSIRYGC